MAGTRTAERRPKAKAIIVTLTILIFAKKAFPQYNCSVLPKWSCNPLAFSEVTDMFLLIWPLPMFFWGKVFHYWTKMVHSGFINAAEPIWHTEVIAVLSIFRDSLIGNIPATHYHKAECRHYMLVIICTMTIPFLQCWHGCIGSTTIKRVGRLCILPVQMTFQQLSQNDQYTAF